MNIRYRQTEPQNPFLRYWFNSWIQTCGVGWTPRQVWIGYGFSLLLPLGVLLAAWVTGLGWTWQQMVVAGIMAWDMGGGVVGYNHHAMKRRRRQETSHTPVWHHNLFHFHPLILIFFNSPDWALGLTIPWLISLFFYVEFLEVNPIMGKRRLHETTQKWVIAIEVAIGLALIGVSFMVPNVPADFRLFGIFLYAGLALATFIILHTPLDFQRTTAIIILVIMLITTQFLPAPAGFEWLLPVYLLKLLVGFTAKEKSLPLN